MKTQLTQDEIEDLYAHPRNCRCPMCEGQPEDWVTEEQTLCQAAATMGRSTSPAKAAAARENGRKGGRPKVWAVIKAEPTADGQWRLNYNGEYPQEGYTHPTADAALNDARQMYPTNSVWNGHDVKSGWKIKIG